MCRRQTVGESIIEAVDACPKCGPMMNAARVEQGESMSDYQLQIGDEVELARRGKVVAFGSDWVDLERDGVEGCYDTNGGEFRLIKKFVPVPKVGDPITSVGQLALLPNKSVLINKFGYTIQKCGGEWIYHGYTTHPQDLVDCWHEPKIIYIHEEKK